MQLSFGLLYRGLSSLMVSVIITDNLTDWGTNIYAQLAVPGHALLWPFPVTD
jgi:hypothetical protein